MHRRYSTVKVMSGNIEPATLRRKTFSGKDLELVVSVEKKGWGNVTNTVHHLSVLLQRHSAMNRIGQQYLNSTMYIYSLPCLDTNASS